MKKSLFLVLASTFIMSTLPGVIATSDTNDLAVKSRIPEPWAVEDQLAVKSRIPEPWAVEDQLAVKSRIPEPWSVNQKV